MVNSMVLRSLLLNNNNRENPAKKLRNNKHPNKKLICPASASTYGVSDPTTNNIKQKYLPNKPEIFQEMELKEKLVERRLKE